MEQPYSNRELREMFTDIKDGQVRLEKKQDETIIQTTKTNGRVTKIEKTILVILTALGVLTLSRPDILSVILKLLVL